MKKRIKFTGSKEWEGENVFSEEEAEAMCCAMEAAVLRGIALTGGRLADYLVHACENPAAGLSMRTKTLKQVKEKAGNLGKRRARGTFIPAALRHAWRVTGSRPLYTAAQVQDAELVRGAHELQVEAM